MVKWIVVTGGVLSGLGKGVVTASIGRLFSSSYKVVPIKCDGYLNVDCGTMNPMEHGEVFVQDDGGEVDLDFGHYERFLNKDTKFAWSITSGKIFERLRQKERKGEFLGHTVQIIPHVTGEIRKVMKTIAENEKADILLIEIGGTVGDLENLWFLEAMREVERDEGKENIMFVHLGYIPVLDSQGQQKTKPLQQSTFFLRERGINPDVFVGRSKDRLSEKTKKKIHWLCNVKENAVISDPDCSTIYELPLIFQEEGMPELIARHLNLKIPKKLKQWEKLVHNIKNPEKEVTIGICGKYTELADSYLSVVEALVHSGAHNNAKVNVKWIDTTDLENGKTSVEELLNDVKGIIIPGGFGTRGAEGKIALIKYVRENNIPFLGICYGLQLATVEFARNVCNLPGANTTEIEPLAEHPVVDILPEQRAILDKGGTMRLGAYEAVLTEMTKISSLYNQKIVSERHRHRYEVNPEYHKILTDNGLVLAGTSEDKRLAEFIELRDHPYFVATQGHPELKSRLEAPAPLFLGLVKACLD